MISKSLKVSYNNSINSANTFINMYCHFTDDGNAVKLPNAGAQPTDSGGATVEHQGNMSFCVKILMN